jgi:hypothetical protein
MEIKRFFARSVVVVLLLVVALSIPSFGQTNREPRLRYAQVASGQSGSQTYVTTLLVSNANNFAVPAAIDSSDAANPNNSIGLGFQTNCAVDSSSLFTIAAFSSCRFTSTYNGPLKTGWLGVTENPQPSGSSGVDPIGGYLVFTLWQGNQFTGYPIFTVGVSPTPIYYQFSIPVVRDTASNTDVGFAMANPFSDGPTGVVAQLVDSSGNVVEQQNITLSTLGHTSQFLSQMFPTTLGNAANFVGNLVVTAQTANDGVIATSLIQQGAQYGGAPPTTMSVKVAKQANAGTLRADGGMVREREKISSVPGPTVF